MGWNRVWWRKQATVFPDGPPVEPAVWEPPLTEGVEMLIRYRPETNEITITDPLLEISPRRLAVHTERPKPEAYYRNGLVFGPELTPWTFGQRPEDAPTLVVTYGSLWEAERCVAIRPVEPIAVVSWKDTLTMTVTMTDVPTPWEEVPIPEYRGRARAARERDPIAEILGDG